jgi:hypothetical protein
MGYKGKPQGMEMGTQHTTSIGKTKKMLMGNGYKGIP